MKGVVTAMSERSTKKPKKLSMRTNVVDRADPTLRFSPTAWAKLLFLRDYGKTEVGGFGVTPTDDLLYVEDMQLVRQTCSWAHVAFDDGIGSGLF